VESNNTEDLKKNSNSIKISSVRASDNKLEVELDISKKIAKYFFKNHFEVTYDKNIGNVDESILSIPAVCVTIQVAWATGADLYVEKLDETFLSSLPKIRKVFEGFYPKFSSSGDIHVQKIITNKFNNKQIATLFSGGLDSIVSYITQKDKHPILITIQQSTTSPQNKDHDSKMRNLHQKFAEQEGLRIHFIESDLLLIYSDTLNNQLLAYDFETKDWAGYVNMGLVTTGLCAPLTGEKIGRLVLASAYPKNYRQPDSAHFLDYIDFSWADINVFYDNSDLSRQEKIRHVLKLNPQYLKYLRSCIFANQRRSDLKECGECIKCLRTIAGLILEGIDPNECNFDIKNDILDYIKTLFIKRLKSSDIYFWKDIQNHIPNTIKDDEVSKKYHAKEFFEWFRGFELANYQQELSFFSKFRRLFYSLKSDGIYISKQKIRMDFLKRTSKKKR